MLAATVIGVFALPRTKYTSVRVAARLTEARKTARVLAANYASRVQPATNTNATVQKVVETFQSGDEKEKLLKQAKKDKNAKRNRDWRAKHSCIDSPIYKRFMLNAARKRAKDKGLEFSITLEDIVIPEKCPILGLFLEVSKGKPSDNSPSLDRINPDKGYVPGNVGVISYRANSLKFAYPVEVFENLVAWMKKASA